jgi:hypothetical protein
VKQSFCLLVTFQIVLLENWQAFFANKTHGITIAIGEEVVILCPLFFKRGGQTYLFPRAKNTLPVGLNNQETPSGTIFGN